MDFTMEKDKPIFHIFGMATGPIAILFDIITEMHGEVKFKIWQNISVEEKITLPLTVDEYQYRVYNPDESDRLKGYDTSNVAFGVPGSDAKQSVYEYFFRHADIAESMYNTIVHPTAYVSPSVELASGVLLEPGTIISAQTDIDFGVTIKRGVSIGHHDRIGRFCEINPGVFISGNVTVGKKTVIGTNTSIKDNVKIGCNTTIGMGSNVVSDIPSGVVAYGNPCQVSEEKS